MAIPILKTTEIDDLILKEDVVNRPEHYNKQGVECIDGIQASMDDTQFAGYLKGNVIKYLWRYNYKGKPLQDLLKAQWYLNRLIKETKDNG